MIDFQGYNKDKRVFYRSNVFWEEAFEILETKKRLEVDKIDIQIYTDSSINLMMPVTDVEDLRSIRDAQNWINFTMGELIKHGNGKEDSIL